MPTSTRPGRRRLRWAALLATLALAAGALGPSWLLQRFLNRQLPDGPFASVAAESAKISPLLDGLTVRSLRLTLRDDPSQAVTLAEARATGLDRTALLKALLGFEDAAFSVLAEGDLLLRHYAQETALGGAAKLRFGSLGLQGLKIDWANQRTGSLDHLQLASLKAADAEIVLHDGSSLSVDGLSLFGLERGVLAGASLSGLTIDDGLDRRWQAGDAAATGLDLLKILAALESPTTVNLAAAAAGGLESLDLAAFSLSLGAEEALSLNRAVIDSRRLEPDQGGREADLPAALEAALPPSPAEKPPAAAPGPRPDPARRQSLERSQERLWLLTGFTVNLETLVPELTWPPDEIADPGQALRLTLLESLGASPSGDAQARFRRSPEGSEIRLEVRLDGGPALTTPTEPSEPAADRLASPAPPDPTNRTGPAAPAALDLVVRLHGGSVDLGGGPLGLMSASLGPGEARLEVGGLGPRLYRSLERRLLAGRPAGEVLTAALPAFLAWLDLPDPAKGTLNREIVALELAEFLPRPQNLRLSWRPGPGFPWSALRESAALGPGLLGAADATSLFQAVRYDVLVGLNASLAVNGRAPAAIWLPPPPKRPKP
ncbi:MAG: hypothetical protein LBU12_08845 [Deltaproteobacteria bacterium]|jgi:hypothetical protein|nr:hypothetical protein [Deltaproteobacteria bacterium]